MTDMTDMTAARLYSLLAVEANDAETLLIGQGGGQAGGGAEERRAAPPLERRLSFQQILFAVEAGHV